MTDWQWKGIACIALEHSCQKITNWVTSVPADCNTSFWLAKSRVFVTIETQTKGAYNV